MPEFERAVRKPPRELFDREDTDFTPWLEENIDYLNQEMGISLVVTEREQETHTGLQIDLSVEDEDSGREGVIECQIEKSDHDHLGKLLTYISAFDSKFAIWIVKEPRYEHRKTIEWLNESTEKDFYLVTIESVEIKEAKAPLFTTVVEPSPTAKEIGVKRKEPNERQLKQEQFWTELLEKSQGEFDLFDNISPRQQGWFDKSAGIGNVFYRYRIRNHWADVSVYIGTGSKQRNEQIFDQLQGMKDSIESQFGDELDWQRLENSKACRIAYPVAEKGLRDDEDWEEIQDRLIQNMKQLYDAFDDPIQSISHR